MANTHRTSAQWEQIFKQHASSGLQIAVFCKQQHITPSSFYAWRKRLAKKSLITSVDNKSVIADTQSTDWINIPAESAAASSHWDIELALPNGIVLRMMNR